MAISNSNSYQDLEKFVQNSEVYLSIFGTRMVSIQKNEDSIPLDALAEKVCKLSNRDTKYSYEECLAAVAIRSKLITHYNSSDELLDNSWNIIVIFYRAIHAIFKSCLPDYTGLLVFGPSWRSRISDDKYMPAVFSQAFDYNIPMD